MKCMAVTQMRETLGYFYKCPNLNVLDIASGNWLGNKLPMMIVKQWAEQGISVQTGSDWVQYQVADFNKRLTALYPNSFIPGLQSKSETARLLCC